MSVAPPPEAPTVPRPAPAAAPPGPPAYRITPGDDAGPRTERHRGVLGGLILVALGVWPVLPGVVLIGFGAFIQATMFGAPFAMDKGKWSFRMLAARGPTIYAGTNQIQHNIIGERVLGLPKG